MPATDGNDLGFFRRDRRDIDRLLKRMLEAEALLEEIREELDAFSYQPLDADLTAIAALDTEEYGRGILEMETEEDARDYLNAQEESDQLEAVTELEIADTVQGIIRYMVDQLGYQPGNDAAWRLYEGVGTNGN